MDIYPAEPQCSHIGKYRQSLYHSVHKRRIGLANGELVEIQRGHRSLVIILQKHFESIVDCIDGVNAATQTELYALHCCLIGRWSFETGRDTRIVALQMHTPAGRCAAVLLGVACLLVGIASAAEIHHNYAHSGDTFHVAALMQLNQATTARVFFNDLPGQNNPESARLLWQAYTQWSTAKTNAPPKLYRMKTTPKPKAWTFPPTAVAEAVPKNPPSVTDVTNSLKAAIDASSAAVITGKIRAGWNAAAAAACNTGAVDTLVQTLVDTQRLPHVLFWSRSSNFHPILNATPKIIGAVAEGLRIAKAHADFTGIESRRPLAAYIGQPPPATITAASVDPAVTAINAQLTPGDFTGGQNLIGAWDNAAFTNTKATCPAAGAVRTAFCTLLPGDQNYYGGTHPCCVKVGAAWTPKADGAAADQFSAAANYQVAMGSKVCWSYFLGKLQELGVVQIGMRSGSLDNGALLGMKTLAIDVNQEQGIDQAFFCLSID